ncbi:MAG: BON domain-containing protein [Candidatus Puniceispirillaceae bacterium]
MMSRFIPIMSALLLSFSLALSACAPALVGVGTAAVAASSTEKGFSTSVADGVIITKISDRFLRDDVDLVEGVSVSVNEGAVLMTGIVPTQEKKINATRIAWSVKGVREVVNEITVSEGTSLKTKAKDFSAAAQLRVKLIGESSVSSLNFSIDVVDGVVYLSGVASSEEERAKVIELAQELPFAKKVVDYIILSSDRRD